MMLSQSGKIFALLLICGFLTACEDEVEILYDDWGIPHIYASQDEQLAYGLAWSQMRNHGSLILSLYGQSSGRAAEYWGDEWLTSDRHVWRMGIPKLAAAHYTKLRKAERKNIDAFAAALNEYVKEHATEFNAELKQVLPIRGQDVAQHIAFTLYMPNKLATDGIIQSYIQSGTAAATTTAHAVRASNGWAIGPKKSLSGKPILLSNTHFPWPNNTGFEQFVWHEAHMIGKGIDIYGVGLIGIPALTMGFNETKAWTITAMNEFDVLDVYELDLAGDGYTYDDKIIEFETDTHVVKIKKSDGSFDMETLTIRRSVHGPIIYETNNKALAIRTAIPKNMVSTDLWDMAKANTLDEFLVAMENQSLIPLNILYADVSGNILYTIAGILPDRSQIEADSRGILSGNTSATLWHGKVPFEKMPKVINPESGYLQNSNQPPWSVTLPRVLEPSDFPHDWPEPKVTLRTASSIKMLTDRAQFSFNDVVEDKYSTRSELAERVLDDLLGFAQASDRPLVQQAAQVLANWDRNYNSDSIGAVLFTFWALQLEPKILAGVDFPEHLYATSYNNELPLTTPRGLADKKRSLHALEIAANSVNHSFGSLYVPWGAFLRFQLDNKDISGYGAPNPFGVFSANIGFSFKDNEPLTTIAGDTWVFVVDFDNPESAKAVMSYSNATQAGSVHRSDQLDIYASKQVREIYRSRKSIMAHLESRRVINFSSTEDLR